MNTSVQVTDEKSFLSWDRLNTKLLVAFLFVGLIPFSIISFIAVHEASEALSGHAFNRIDGIVTSKKNEIEQFFAKRKADTAVLVKSIGALQDESFQKIEVIRNMKKADLECYFKTIRNQILTFSEDKMVIDAMKQFRPALKLKKVTLLMHNGKEAEPYF